MRQRRLGIVCSAVVGLALVGCERAPIAEVGDAGRISLASGGDTLFIASERPPDGTVPGMLVLDALRGTQLTPVFTLEASSTSAFHSLVATSSGDAYFSLWGESRVAHWDAAETTWIEMPGSTVVHAYGDHVWAQSMVGGERVLSRIDGDGAIEIRRDDDAPFVGIACVLPSGNVVWRTGSDTAEEVDETGAVVGPFPVDHVLLARGEVTLSVHQDGQEDDRGTVTFARDGRTTVAEPLRGTFVGAGEGAFDDIDWVLRRVVPTGWHDNGDQKFSPMICVQHFDGTSSTETACTEPTDLALGAIVHADSVFYALGNRIYELPMR